MKMVDPTVCSRQSGSPWCLGHEVEGKSLEQMMKVKPIGMLPVMLAGWMNQHQQDVIEYLKEENKALREKFGKKRILLNDSQRMRLARLGKRLGRRVLADASCIFSPDIILRWHRI